METLYSTEFLDVFRINENRIDLKWKMNTEYATEEEFMKWNTDLAKIVMEVAPKMIYSDCSAYLFIITPDLQEWSKENLFKHFRQAGMQKMAILVSRELFSQVSLEQFTDEGESEDVITRYFETKKQALDWLES